mgnify:CR=1 FL=1
MANIDEIADIRGVDIADAVAFWEQVNAAAPCSLSTHDVLMLLREQEDKASAVTSRDLASTAQAQDKPSLSVADKPKPSGPSKLPSLRKQPKRSGASTRKRAKPPERTRAHTETTLARRYGLDSVEAEELRSLLKNMAPLGFESSKQLSTYICKHKLGHQYPNISGIVRMRQNGEEWDFRGGFPPSIYKIICCELGLRNEGTSARAVGFTSFEALDSGRDR